MPQDDQINYNVKVRLDPNTQNADSSVIYDFSAKKFALGTGTGITITNPTDGNILTADGTQNNIIGENYLRFANGVSPGTANGNLIIGTTVGTGGAANGYQRLDIGDNATTSPFAQLIVHSTVGGENGPFVRFGLDDPNVSVIGFGAKDEASNKKFQIGTYGDKSSTSFTPYLSMNHAGRLGAGIDWDGFFIDDANSGLEIAGNYLNSIISSAGPNSTAVLKITSTSSTTTELNIAQIVRLNIPQSGFSPAVPAIAPRFIDFQVTNNTPGGTLANPYSAGYILYTPSGGASLHSVSDKRLKKNFRPLPVGLPELLLINPIEYEWKGSSIAEKGFIAQELYKIYPDAVNKPLTDDVEKEAWTISYSKLTPLLVKSIQDQQEIIKNLEKRIETLEKKTN